MEILIYRSDTEKVLLKNIIKHTYSDIITMKCQKYRRGNMLSRYISSAMKKARYEILKDDNSFYGEIPGFKGVYANSETLEDCREELEEVLEEWLFFRISKNLAIPDINGIKLEIKEVAV